MNPPASHSPDNANVKHGNSILASPHHDRPKPTRKLRSYLWIGGIVAVVLAAVAVTLFLRMTIREPFKGPTYTVKKEPMRVTIVERGSLESAENSEITVRVKAGTKGSTN